MGGCAEYFSHSSVEVRVQNIHGDMTEYLANTLAFVVVGIIIAGRVYQGHDDAGMLRARDYGWAVALWLLLLVRNQS